VNEPHLLSTVANIALALDYLWHRNIPHQVPQAKNILINAAGEAKLINVKAVDRLPARRRATTSGRSHRHRRTRERDRAGEQPVAELLQRMMGAQKIKPFAR